MGFGFDENDIFVGKDVPTIKYDYFENKERVYHPDIYVKSQNLLVEVKSDYTFCSEKEKNLAKWKAAFSSEYNFEIYIYGRKGELLEFVKDFKYFFRTDMADE